MFLILSLILLLGYTRIVDVMHINE